MPRLVQISPEAQRVMVAGFRERKPASVIALLVREGTGERVTVRTIERRAAAWRAEQVRRQAAREQMEDLVAAMKANDATAPEMIQALAQEALMLHPQKWADADPIKVQAQNLYAEEIRLKREKLDVQRRAVEVQERRLALLEEKQRAAVSELEKLERKTEITPDDLRRIREIYGLQN